MSLFRIDWLMYPTDAVFDRLNEIAGANAQYESLRNLVGSICLAAGGLPVTPVAHDKSRRYDISLRLITEATSKVVSKHAKRRSSGYIREEITAFGDELSHEILPFQPLNINTANVRQLDLLPDIGPELARRIVKDRHQHGAFESLVDLAQRVSGIGTATINNIRYRVSVQDPANDLALRPTPGDLESNLTWLLARINSNSAEARLLRALDLVATICAESPHPFTEQHQPRKFDHELPGDEINAVYAGLLIDSHYYTTLNELMHRATSSIDVCMFHIALPSANHPTKKLLDTVIDVHNSGAEVRVLMDADRPSDPYLSSVINLSAKNHLEQAGVAVRFDAADTLMHSKFVIVDKTWTIVGSHNWSAGSYFQFDDFSIAVKLKQLSNLQTDRFDAMWAAAG